MSVSSLAPLTSPKRIVPRTDLHTSESKEEEIKKYFYKIGPVLLERENLEEERRFLEETSFLGEKTQRHRNKTAPANGGSSARAPPCLHPGEGPDPPAAGVGQSLTSAGCSPHCKTTSVLSCSLPRKAACQVLVPCLLGCRSGMHPARRARSSHLRSRQPTASLLEPTKTSVCKTFPLPGDRPTLEA